MRRVDPADDGGAVAVIAAVCLLALVGIGAIAVDAGALFLEKRELQNGADAAALAVAQDCAGNSTGPLCTQSGAHPTAQNFANSNARDSLSTVPAGGVTINHTSGKVVVRAVTNDPSSANASLLRHFFAPAFGRQGTAVEAQGAALWGSIVPASVDTIPLVLSACEWEKFQATPYFPAKEPWTVATNGPPQVALFHSDATPCTLTTGIVGTSPSGQLTPGGFGWLDTYSGQCLADIINGWMPTSPGGSSPSNCSSTWFEENLLGKVVVFPVFDATNGLTGNNTQYRYSAYAAIYVTGYSLGGPSYRRSLPGFSLPCGPPNTCIAGWFTEGYIGGGVLDPTAPSTGVKTVQMTLP